MSDELRRKQLIKALNAQKELPALTLVDKYITDEGCPLVANFLKTNSGFREVDLKSNKITPNGFLKLCEAFRVMKNLRTLSLNNNYLGQDNRALEGLYSVMINLDTNIEELNLRNNDIGDENLSPLLALIAEAKNLQKLDLRFNKLTTLGGEKLLNTLSHARRRIQVQITGNQIKQPVLSGLMDFVHLPSDAAATLRRPRGGPPEALETGLPDGRFARPLVYPYDRLPKSIPQTEEYLDELNIISFENNQEIENLRRRFDVLKRDNQQFVQDNAALKSELN
jgi:Leucine-rich repeat (LRR) protein